MASCQARKTVQGAEIAKEKILVVEDDEDIQELVEFNLSREGYQVLKVSSGEDALSVEKRGKPVQAANIIEKNLD